MRIIILCLSLAAASCSNGDATPLTETDWTNGKQPCSENRLSFRNGQIAYYPKGSQPLVFAKINAMTNDASDPNLTTVIVMPTREIIETAERTVGHKAPSDFQLIMRFRVDDGSRLAVADAKASEDEEFRPPSGKLAGLFDLLRCK